jgi:hypothetical protein
MRKEIDVRAIGSQAPCDGIAAFPPHQKATNEVVNATFQVSTGTFNVFRGCMEWERKNLCDACLQKLMVDDPQVMAGLLTTVAKNLGPQAQ